jgi:hypothetical protein
MPIMSDITVNNNRYGTYALFIFLKGLNPISILLKEWPMRKYTLKFHDYWYNGKDYIANIITCSTQRYLGLII